MSKNLTADERIERLEAQMWVVQGLLKDIRKGCEDLRYSQDKISVLVLKLKDRRAK